MEHSITIAPLLLASAISLAAFEALATPRLESIDEKVQVREFDGTFNTIQDSGLVTADPSGTRLHIELGNGRDAFNQPAFSEAFASVPNGDARYWVNISSDSHPSPASGGIGGAQVILTYMLVKTAPNDTFVLHITGGNLQLLDGDFGTFPLSAAIDLSAGVFSTGGVFSNFDAHASLTGNAGAAFNTTFDFRSNGLGVTQADFTEQKSGTNVVGATLDIPKIDIPIDISGPFVDTEFGVEVILSSEVITPGGEVLGRAFLRDPAHVDDTDPFAGALSITLGEDDGGPVAPMPEPATLSVVALALPVMFALRTFTRRSRRTGGR
jgi:hypothetical protein